MQSIIQWLTSLGFSAPGMVWFKYVVAALILLVVLDAFLNILFAGLHTIFTGGKK